MASVKTITLPDGSSYDFKATYDVEGNNISETYINKNEKGAASGVAPLNSSGKIDETYLPASDFVSESGSIVSFDYNKADVPFSSLKVKISPIQYGSGDPSPTNIREIIGFDAANISVGKNLYNSDLLTWKQGLINADGTIDTSWTAYQYSNPVPISGGNAYVISATRNDKSSGVALSFYEDDYTFIETNVVFPVAGAVNGYVSKDFIVPANAEYYRIRRPKTDAHFTNIQIEKGSTPTSYSAATTYTTDFDSAGTVYGGELDVLSGKLIVTHKGVDMGTVSWSYITTSVSHPVFSYSFSDRKYGSNSSGIVGLCSCYGWCENATLSILTSDLLDKQFGFQSTNAWVRIRDDAYTDAATFKTAVSGNIIVYELVTPLIYQLTPTEVTTLLGQNNVWCDSGDTELSVLPTEISNYIKSLTLVVSQNSTTGELTLS